VEVEKSSKSATASVNSISCNVERGTSLRRGATFLFIMEKV